MCVCVLTGVCVGVHVDVCVGGVHVCGGVLWGVR